MKIIYMGTPNFAVKPLEEINEIHEVIAVVTQPDKKVGRKQIITPTPVKEFAINNNIKVFQPIKIKEDYQSIIDLKPDLIITCAYGQIIPEIILNTPPLGCINIHASLLPKLRGGAPIHKAIINGHKTTGITIMYMDKTMDTGDIITQESINIENNDNVGTLHDKLSILGSSLIIKTLPSIENKTNKRIKQNDEEATYAYNIKREEEQIDFNKTSEEIYNQIRGLNPWPLAYMLLDNEEIKVIEASITERINDDQINITKDHIIIKTKDKAIALSKIKPFGKKIMNVKDYLNGIDKEQLKKKKITLK